MLASYSEIARRLSEHFGRTVSRQQVFMWHQRRTLNRDRQMFPAPRQELTDPKRTKPRLLFDVDQAIRWYAAGVPGKDGQGWK